MSKKKKKNIPVFYLSAEENTLRYMPQYNGFIIGHGAHGDRKYNRRKAKKAFQNQLKDW